MNSKIILFLTAIGMALLLCGCGSVPKPGTEDPSHPDQSEPEGEPLEITSFSFHRTASMADGCFCLELTRVETGTQLHAEELFSGGRVLDMVINEDVLDGLGELTGAYHVDRWDGFEKKNSNVLDGSTFSLELTLADGSTISARGNNSFPKNYSDVYASIWSLYTELMETYSGVEEGADLL